MQRLIAITALVLFLTAAGGCSSQEAKTKDTSGTADRPTSKQVAPATMTDHPPPKKTTVAAPDAGSIASTDDGAIADIYAGKDRLAGKTITVRAKVMKFSPMIMGKNWVHLQDGSGDAKTGTNDLTATTSAAVAPGDIVLATGTLAAGRDFGAGYKYAVILEDVTFAGKSN